MAWFRFYYPSDKIGMKPIDLHTCVRMFRARIPNTNPDGDLLEYYQFPEDLWIERIGDNDNESGEWCEGFRQVHPETVARKLLENKCQLPPELEEHRKYGNNLTYWNWLWDQQGVDEDNPNDPEHRIPEPESERPRWDKENRVLLLRDRTLYEFDTARAKNVFVILDAFQAAGWVSSVRDPFKNLGKLDQTIRDIKRKLIPPFPLEFDRRNRRVSWRLLRPDN